MTTSFTFFAERSHSPNPHYRLPCGPRLLRIAEEFYGRAAISLIRKTVPRTGSCPSRLPSTRYCNIVLAKDDAHWHGAVVLTGKRIQKLPVPHFGRRLPRKGDRVDVRLDGSGQGGDIAAQVSVKLDSGELEFVLPIGRRLENLVVPMIERRAEFVVPSVKRSCSKPIRSA